MVQNEVAKLLPKAYNVLHDHFSKFEDDENSNRAIAEYKRLATQLSVYGASIAMGNIKMTQEFFNVQKSEDKLSRVEKTRKSILEFVNKLQNNVASPSLQQHIQVITSLRMGLLLFESSKEEGDENGEQ